MPRPKQTMVDAATHAERERCLALVRLVATQPETYAQRVGLPDASAAMVELIEGGYQAHEAPSYEERSDGEPEAT